MKKRAFLCAVALVVLAGSGCQSVYYGTMEKLGYPKRDILTDRVEAAKDSQEAAKEEFVSALESFKAMVDFDGGQLEARYHKLQEEYDRCSKRAADVSRRISAVEDVASALFREWEAELSEYSSPQLKRTSERQLQSTRQDYERLINAMRVAEGRMDPVLSVLKDQVLFLKHNLNARAIASLQTELDSIENDVAELVRDMEAAISQAEVFIRDLS